VMTLPGNGSGGHNRCESSTSTPSLDNASNYMRQSNVRGSIGPPRETSRTARLGSVRMAGDELANSFRTVRGYVSGELQIGSMTSIQPHQRHLSLGLHRPKKRRKALP